MRMLHVVPEYWPSSGGIQTLCENLSRELTARGHQVRVAASARTEYYGYLRFGFARYPSLTDTRDGIGIVRLFGRTALYDLAGWLVERMPAGRMRASAQWQAMKIIRRTYVRDVVRQVRDFRPDVVMAVSAAATSTKLVLEARRRIDFPLVVSAILHTELAGSDDAFLGRLFGAADSVVALTPYEAGVIQNRYGVDSSKIFVAPMGARPQPEDASSREQQVLFLGRKVPHKGIPALIEAMRIVWQTRPEARLVLAGARNLHTTGVDEFIAGLSQEEKSRIVSLDDISEDEKAQLLARSSCLVLLSRIESFGIVLLEAWSHGTPVITWDLPVFRCIVSDGEDGLLVRPDDREVFAQAIMALVTDPLARQRMGSAGREKVRRQFNWAKSADAYLHAYQHAMERAGSRRKSARA